jgi:hypothetical protein
VRDDSLEPPFEIVAWPQASGYSRSMNKEDKKRIAARLARTTAMLCVRNTQLETLHDGLTPVTRTGGYSDVSVHDADGRRIPWSEVSRIDENEMRALMQEIANRLYTFHICADEPGLRVEIDRWMAVASRWDEPDIDHRMIAGRAEPH